MSLQDNPYSKMKNPKISVIMPVYNAEKFLDKAIKSILNQTFKDFEFIIINDGSKDNSLKIIKEFQKKDKRIVLINNKKNLGLQKTLNKGLRISKGKYIARMDSDDISMERRFEIQFSYLENHPSIFLIGCSAIVIDSFGNKLGVFRKYGGSKKLRKKILKNNCIIHPSIMFRNEDEIFYREKFKTSEDYDLYLRLLSSGKNMANLHSFLIKYRISEGSFVSTMKNQEFFYQKAKEFYKQRLKYGKDDYDKLDKIKIPKKNIKNPFEKTNLTIKILVEFQDNQMIKVRKDVKHYFKIYGFDKKLASYYFLSWIPIRLTLFIRRKIA